MQQKFHRLNLPSLPLSTHRHTHKFSNSVRQGGIRLEQQLINDKHIYHSYGQGQSQFSLAYGCAYIASKMITLKREDYKTKDVAVVGDGVTGLLTALELAKRGHRVTLYTPRLLVEGKRVAAGEGLQFWYPAHYDNCDPLKHELLSKLSFQFLQHCISSNRYQSLKQAPVYCLGPRREQLNNQITEFITKQVHQCTVQYSNGKQEPCTYFNTILINTELFIEELWTELKLRGIPVVLGQFGSLEHLAGLSEDFVYDCLGVIQGRDVGDGLGGVSQIDNFNVVVQVQGVQGGEDYVIWVSSEMEGEDDYVMYFTKNKLQISSANRSAKDYNKEMQKNSQKLLAKAYHFLKQRTVKPYRL